MTEAAATVQIDVLFSAETIATRTEGLAAEIRAAGFRENVLVVAVLKGSFVFAADLIRALHYAGVSPQVDFISLSSYRAGTTSSGTVSVLRDLETDVVGRDVLIIDDILESGRTLAYARDLVLTRGARRAGVVVLLTNPQSAWHRSKPILSASFVRRSSSSATAWIWATRSANCHSSDMLSARIDRFRPVKLTIRQIRTVFAHQMATILV